MTISSNPIAPPSISPVAPAIPGGQASAVLEAPIPQAAPEDKSLNGRYEKAVVHAHRDTGPLEAIAEETKGTPVGDIVKENVDKVKARKEQFNQVVGGVDVNTPEGRKILADNYQKLSDPKKATLHGYESIHENPKWGDALMYMIMGQKEKAAQSVLGGPYKLTTEYDMAGNALSKYTNDLGQYYIKDASGNFVPKETYLKNGGSSTLENSLSYKAKSNNIERNNQQLFDESKGVYGTNVFTTKQDPTWKTLEEGFRGIKNSGEMSPEQKLNAMRMISGTISNNRSVSSGLQALNQASNSQEGRVGKEDIKAANLALGTRGSPFHVSDDGKLVDSSGQSKSWSELKSSMGNFSNSEQIDKSYQTNQEALLKEYQLGNLGPTAYKQLQVLLDAQKQLDKEHDEFKKQGIQTPLFIRETLANNTGDEMSRPIIQAMQGQFNTEVTKLYKDFRENELTRLRNENPLAMPSPLQMQSAFIDTPQYQTLVDKYEAKKNAELNSPYVSAKNTNNATPFETRNESPSVSNVSGVNSSTSKESPIEKQRTEHKSEQDEEAKRKHRDEALKRARAAANQR